MGFHPLGHGSLIGPEWPTIIAIGWMLNRYLGVVMWK